MQMLFQLSAKTMDVPGNLQDYAATALLAKNQPPEGVKLAD